MPVGLLYTGHSLDILKTLPDESVHCVVTSPPYQTPTLLSNFPSRKHFSRFSDTESALRDLLPFMSRCLYTGINDTGMRSLPFFLNAGTVPVRAAWYTVAGDTPTFIAKSSTNTVSSAVEKIYFRCFRGVTSILRRFIAFSACAFLMRRYGKSSFKAYAAFLCCMPHAYIARLVGAPGFSRYKFPPNISFSSVTA